MTICKAPPLTITIATPIKHLDSRFNVSCGMLHFYQRNGFEDEE